MRVGWGAGLGVRVLGQVNVPIHQYNHCHLLYDKRITTDVQQQQQQQRQWH
jgi:hypothetical protein